MLLSETKSKSKTLIPLNDWIRKSFIVSLNIDLCFINNKLSKNETVPSSKKNHILRTLELKRPPIKLKIIKKILKNFIDKNKRKPS